jgi:putative restriction endonuclease
VAQNLWTREQTIVAFNLYCQIPFGKITSTHPEIIRVAKIIGRTPAALSMKMGNLASFDPKLRKRGIVGLTNASKLDEEIWNEFNSDWGKHAFESEVIFAKFIKKTLEEVAGIDLNNLPKGEEREKVVKARINQSFFRNMILSSYNQKCCITNISIPELLVSSHIVPWSVDETIRMDPRNGLCLNTFHDKAFDCGYITISPEFKIKVSTEVSSRYKKDNIAQIYLQSYDNKTITLPERFLPGKEYLDYHNKNIFRK